MSAFLLYIATVLIWGSTWYAIKLQLGTVAPEVSLFYRFGLAALLLLGWCVATGKSLRFAPRDHGFFALLGLFLFGLNYLLFYIATEHLTTGLIAIIFSTIVVMNIFNGAIFLKRPVELRTVIGAALGLAGIATIFSPEFQSGGLSTLIVASIVLSIAATYSASLGNIVAVRNQQAGLPVIQGNALGMSYGAILMGCVAVLRDLEFNYDPTWAYTGSLLYLSIFGSVIAFWCYLTLLGRIGPERAAYATVLFPVVALTLSTVLEDYSWTTGALIGALLVLIGNVVILSDRLSIGWKRVR